MHIQLTNEYRLIAAAIVSNQRALSYQRCQSIGYYYSGTGTTELCAASMDGWWTNGHRYFYNPHKTVAQVQLTGISRVPRPFIHVNYCMNGDYDDKIKGE